MPYTSLDGVRIFYEQAGTQGVPLVFIHGGGCTHHDWVNQLEGLGRTHIVVACDLRGHGQSSDVDPENCTLPQMAADIGNLIFKLGLDRPVLIGHSYGTRVALLAAAAHPFLVRGVVFVDGSRVFAGTRAEVEAILGEWRDVKRRFKRVSDELLIEGLPAAERERIVRTMRETSPEVLWAITRTSGPWEAAALPAVLAGSPVPLLAIQSTYHDNFTPRYSLAKEQTSPYIDLLRKAKPDTSITVLDGIGHFSMLEAPQEVNERISSFVSGI